MTTPADGPAVIHDTPVIPTDRLPRLLYLGDVPVEASYHGSALLHRLLAPYPPDRLHVVEYMRQSDPRRRLPGVDYRHVGSPLTRGLHSRFRREVSVLLWAAARRRWRQAARSLGAYAPQAVLTVGHGYSWLTAAALAQRRGLPLHLIVHDDWPRTCDDFPPVQRWIDRAFGRVYRQAASRMCVSPYMAEEYHRRYGVAGTVLYPCRAADAVRYDAPPERLRQPTGSCTAVFAGSINAPGYRRALRLLADCLAAINGRLLLYGPLSYESVGDIHQGRDHVEVRGLVTSAALVEACRKEADVLFVPMSFDPRDRYTMAMGFPSKLTDYTAMGLPLLVYGPDYCSAVRWARENQGAGLVVTSESGDALAAALAELQSPPRRWELAAAALRLGAELFDYRQVAPRLYRELADTTIG